MKNLLFCSLIMLQCLSGNAQTTCSPPKYMRQALTNVIVKGIMLNGLSDMGYNKGVSIMGAYLSQSEQVGFTTTLDAGTTYSFIGGGDDDVRDLDIYLYNDRGVEVTKDTKTDNSPIVVYTPVTTGRYTVKVKMFNTQTAGSFAAMLIMSDKGYNIPINTLKNSIVNLFSTIEAICSRTNKMGFSSAKNQWAMYGGVLEERETTTVTSIRLSGSRRSVIVGGGDQNAYDVDLYLNDAGGSMLKKDEDDDSHPVMIYSGNSYSNYELKMKNARSGGNRALILSAILEVD